MSLTLQMLRSSLPSWHANPKRQKLPAELVLPVLGAPYRPSRDPAEPAVAVPAQATLPDVSLTKVVADDLKGRFQDGKLDLAHLPLHRGILKRFTAAEWMEFLHAFTDSENAIAQIECDADMLPSMLHALEQLTTLTQVFVWAPAQGGQLDFGLLGESVPGQERQVHATIRGMPSAPLHVIASPQLVLEARELFCPAIQRSVFQTRDAGGQLSDEQPLPRPMQVKSEPPPVETRTVSRTLRTVLRRLNANDETVKELTARFKGAELDLSKLGDDAKRCLGEFTRGDWLQLRQAWVGETGQGILYMECDASLLPTLIEPMALLPQLECVSVWAPPEGGALDFGTLGQDKRLRANVLGTPEKPLQITASADLSIEGREAWCESIQESVIFARDRDGTIAPDSKKLPTTRFVPPGGPDLEDGLLQPLTDMLLEIARLPAFIDAPFDVEEVAKAFLDCGGFDERGDFGFDLTRLTSQQVRCIQKLPTRAWAYLQDEVEQAGHQIVWVNIHDDFVIRDLVPSLQQLCPLSRLYVCVPKRGMFIGLGELQGPSTKGQLKEVFVRSRDKQFVVSVPSFTPEVKVMVLPTKSTDGVQKAQDKAPGFLKDSKIYYVDSNHRTVEQRSLLAAAAA